MDPNQTSKSDVGESKDQRLALLGTDFQKQKRFLSNLFQLQWPRHKDILREKSTLTATLYVETVLPKVMQSVRYKRQTFGTRGKKLLPQDNAGPKKVKVTVSFNPDVILCG